MAFAQQQYVELMHPTYSHREKAALEAAKCLKKKEVQARFHSEVKLEPSVGGPCAAILGACSINSS